MAKRRTEKRRPTADEVARAQSTAEGRPPQASPVVMRSLEVLLLVRVVCDVLMTTIDLSYGTFRALDRNWYEIVQAMLVTSIAAAVVFLVWLFRATQTTIAIAPERLPITPDGVVGAYFIPVINLSAPYRDLRILERASGGAHSPLLTRWWIACLVSAFLWILASGIWIELWFDLPYPPENRHAIFTFLRGCAVLRTFATAYAALSLARMVRYFEALHARVAPREIAKVFD